MRKILSFALVLSMILGLTIPCLAVTEAAAVSENREMLYALIAIGAIFTVLLVACVVCLATKNHRTAAGKLAVKVLYITTILVCVVLLLCGYRYYNVYQESMQVPSTTGPQESTQGVTEAPTEPPTQEATEPPTEAPTEPPKPDYLSTFTPQMTENSNPSTWKVNWQIFNGGSLVSEYERENLINFGDTDEYFALPGVATFRGNNFRNSASYGTAAVTQETISATWSVNTGYLAAMDGGWSGSGWTGQPLVVQWPEETKAIMNLYESKKAKENLVEVIYATLDGNVYFLDLDDGSYTRDPLFIGMTFKGSGALDPRGYPILYVGSGDYDANSKSPRMFIISLIDGSILYQYGQYDSLAARAWYAFDSSPLVSADTDTLIWPGECGILYTIKLNTEYDESAGTISVTPDDPVVTRYSTKYGWTRYLGYECSAVAVGNYLYLSENGGLFYCVDLNTMKLVWCQDTKDDSNSTPVFEWGEDGRGYIYTVPSLHWTNVGGWGSVSIYKLDAQTGEIVWEKPYDCGTVEGVSGGVQSSPLLGKEGTDIEGMIIYSIARTPNMYTGKLVALDTETGEEIWCLDMSSYPWSSPVPVYTDDGRAYVVICDSVGNMFFVDGATGKQLDYINLGSNIEASPVVFNNTIVVGTRGCKIYGVTVK